jgi:hypothetical protein
MLERARQKDGRQVVPVDVDRDDVAYLEEFIGGLEPRASGERSICFCGSARGAAWGVDNPGRPIAIRTAAHATELAPRYPGPRLKKSAFCRPSICRASKPPEPRRRPSRVMPRTAPSNPRRRRRRAAAASERRGQSVWRHGVADARAEAAGGRPRSEVYARAGCTHRRSLATAPRLAPVRDRDSSLALIGQPPEPPVPTGERYWRRRGCAPSLAIRACGAGGG